MWRSTNKAEDDGDSEDKATKDGEGDGAHTFVMAQTDGG